MANFIQFELDASNSINLNVDNVYDVSFNSKAGNVLGFWYNYSAAAITAGDGVFQVSVTFVNDVTQATADSMQELVRQVNLEPGGRARASSVLGTGFYLRSEDAISNPIAAPLALI